MDFCYSCQKLDISLPNFISHPGSDDNPHFKAPIYSLGTLAEVGARTQQCNLCRLLVSAFGNGPFKKVPSLSNSREVAIFATWINTLGPSREQRLKGSALAILVWPETPRIQQATYKLVIRAVSRILPDQPHFGQLSSVEASFLNFELISCWLKHCEKDHVTCHSDEVVVVKPTTTFLVIDTKYKCITYAPDNCRYIALSYVWGKTVQLTLHGSNLQRLLQRNSLTRFEIPKTISDAMVLVQKLGERYLWVDALCIVQDSDAIRRQCIEDMDRIYMHSLLTIVAATAEDANSPLPGVTAMRKWRQWGMQISPGFALSLHFDYKDFLEHSTYNKRAWTFQEYQLSKRLLIFTPNGQVYYSCKEAVYSEEVVHGKQLNSDVAMSDGAPMVKVEPDENYVWSRYRQGVQALSTRSMTHEGDILNTFRGILRHICPGPSLEGCPTSIFDMALLWQPRERLARRNGFSSWSWAGWLGEVRWFDNDPFPDLSKISETRAVEAWEKENCWIVWYSSFGTDPRSTTYLMEGPPWLRGSSPSAAEHHKRFGFQPRAFAPTPDMLPLRLSKLETQRKYIRYLQFWTVSAYFQIEPSTSAVLRFSSLYAENTGNGLRLFVLRDSNGTSCGWVLLDEGWVEGMNKEGGFIQEFILLSEGHASITERLTEQVHDFREYNAMMIIWRGGIAERAGLGRIIRRGMWSPCKRGMKWKEILLG
ncbi:HET-domain-containing protein [Pyrenochaeta sp. DS3sAY3a]|nr:HET-domain-containing protein [Pyrenochaeta sp. DS3sAY3a]